MMNKTLIMTLLKYLFLISLVVITSACSGKKVMIETPQPEEDFVITCSWSSDFMNIIHGGRKRIKEKVFVASSGELIDCGTYWRGYGPLVSMSHPLYMLTDEKTEALTINGKEIEDVLVIRPITKHTTLKHYKTKLSGRHLVEAANILASPTTFGYVDSLKSGKKLTREHYKKKYEARLTDFWNELLPIVKEDWSKNMDSGKDITVKKMVERYWMGLE